MWLFTNSSALIGGKFIFPLQDLLSSLNAVISDELNS